MILEVLRFPDERLRNIAKPVTVFDEKLKSFINDMFETMSKYNGIGLAATQVDYHQQIIVIDLQRDDEDDFDPPVTSTEQKRFVIINPVILTESGHFENEEGCLSVPGIYAQIKRAEKIKIEAKDVEGKSFTIDADGILSICIQHEMDHLKGKLFVDYLSTLKREKIKKELEKKAKHDA